MKRFDQAPPSYEIDIDRIEEPSGIDRDSTWKEHVAALVKEFEVHGQSVPIILSTIRQHEDEPFNPKTTARFQLLAGSKRLEAARRKKWQKIKAVVIQRDQDTKEAVVKEWVRLIEGQQRFSLTDYDLAKAAINMDAKWKICGREFAEQIGISKPYAYNLMRWHRSVPDKVREAWEKQHPLLNQVELERYSHMSKADALVEWEKRQRQTNGPFSPDQPKKKTPPKPRRASEQQILKIQEAIQQAPLIEPAKELCLNILRFTLGQSREIPGITDYKRLPSAIIDAARAT